MASRFALLGLLCAALLSSGCTQRGRCGPCPPRCALPVRSTLPAPAARRSLDLGPLELARRYGQGGEAVWSFLSATYDRDRDGRVTPAEHGRGEKAFQRMDRDHDGALRAQDFAGPTDMDAMVVDLVLRRLARREAAEPAAPAAGREWVPDAAAMQALLARADADKDGTLTPAEVLQQHEALRKDGAQQPKGAGVPELPAGTHPGPALLAVVDADHDGALSAAELESWRAGREKEAASENDEPTPEQKQRLAGAPEGEPAPDFSLSPPDGGPPVTLSSFRGRRPVALVFGSYTCPPFRHAAKDVRALAERYGRDVQFFFVYIREAHAVDGAAPMPAADQPLVEQPITLVERRRVARVCADALDFKALPTLVDGLDDGAAKAYGAAPIRLYLVGRDGKVAYRGGRGPFRFDPSELEAAIQKALAPAAPEKPAP